MIDNGTPLWETCMAQPRPESGSALDERISAALGSPLLVEHRALLDRVGAHIDPAPWLCKYLEEPYLRLYFPVNGASDEIRLGSLVALMVMYDTNEERTAYVQPVFAGPEIDSLARDLAGRMASPKPQPGPGGELAARRFIEHRRALWSRFEADCAALGRAEASRRWKNDFRWALVRLHLCGKCDGCRYGSPFFDSAGTVPPTGRPRPKSPPSPPSFEIRALAEAIVGSDHWRAKAEHVRRGGIEVRDKPRIVSPLDRRYTLAIFPTNAHFIRAGLIVGVLAYFDTSMARVRYLHNLIAGGEAEWMLLFGDRELGLPQIAAGNDLEEAKRRYVETRRQAWTRFWLDELQFGLDEASRNWLSAFWNALAALVRHGQPGDVGYVAAAASDH